MVSQQTMWGQRAALCDLIGCRFYGSLAPLGCMPPSLGRIDGGKRLISFLSHHGIHAQGRTLRLGFGKGSSPLEDGAPEWEGQSNDASRCTETRASAY